MVMNEKYFDSLGNEKDFDSLGNEKEIGKVYERLWTIEKDKPQIPYRELYNVIADLQAEYILSNYRVFHYGYQVRLHDQILCRIIIFAIKVEEVVPELIKKMIFLISHIDNFRKRLLFDELEKILEETILSAKEFLNLRYEKENNDEK